MNNFKKGVAVFAAAALLAVPMTVSAAGSNANVNVSATVKAAPQANMTLNFDGINFLGSVGDATVPATYTKNGAAGSNTIDLTARGNYTLMVSGYPLNTLPSTDPWGMPTSPQVNLDSKRLKVASPNTGTIVSLTNMPTIIDQGAGDVIKTKKALSFTLDLSRPTPDPSNPAGTYQDNGFFELESKETNLFTQVTLSFTSL